MTVKSVHGVKLSINASAYDMSPLLRTIDFHQVTGRWPVRVEVPAEGFGECRPRLLPAVETVGPDHR